MKAKLKPCHDCGNVTLIYKCYGKEKVCKPCSMKKDPQKPIPKESKKRAKQNREYRKMIIPDGQVCEFPQCRQPATEKHHPGGRTGDKLLGPVKYLCNAHHRLITDNSALGVELGLSWFRNRRA